ncbi:hypothetical protein AGMMS50229_06410 [Campylobacterota bacterium]|nr:hypothetical protein AGMMS50229_06410 [Campylobacterota bacterium]
MTLIAQNGLDARSDHSRVRLLMALHNFRANDLRSIGPVELTIEQFEIVCALYHYAIKGS